eukprot:6805565-Karenia_brevis.AAC.2
MSLMVKRVMIILRVVMLILLMMLMVETMTTIVMLCVMRITMTMITPRGDDATMRLKKSADDNQNGEDEVIV